VKKLGLGGGTTFQQPLLKNSNFFHKMNFFTLDFHLMSFFVCSQRWGVMHVVFSNVFVLEFLLCQ
jgi:hypothetical protein